MVHTESFAIRDIVPKATAVEGWSQPPPAVGVVSAGEQWVQHSGTPAGPGFLLDCQGPNRNHRHRAAVGNNPVNTGKCSPPSLPCSRLGQLVTAKNTPHHRRCWCSSANHEHCVCNEEWEHLYRFKFVKFSEKAHLDRTGTGWGARKALHLGGKIFALSHFEFQPHHVHSPSCQVPTLRSGALGLFFGVTQECGIVSRGDTAPSAVAAFKCCSVQGDFSTGC